MFLLPISTFRVLSNPEGEPIEVYMYVGEDDVRYKIFSLEL